MMSKKVQVLVLRAAFSESNNNLFFLVKVIFVCLFKASIPHTLCLLPDILVSGGCETTATTYDMSLSDGIMESEDKSSWEKTSAQPATQGRLSNRIRPSFSGLFPSGFWKTPRTETAQPLQLATMLPSPQGGQASP